MRFSLNRHLRKVGRGRMCANAPSRRTRTWAGGSSLEGLEERKLLSLAGAAVVSNPTVVEMGSDPLQANFVVSLSFTPKSPLAFSYKTFDESAKAGTDYIAETAPPNPVLVFGPGLPKSITVSVPVNTEPSFHYPKRFGLEVDGPGRVAYGIATIIWRHPRIPHPRVSNPVVIQPFGT